MSPIPQVKPHAQPLRFRKLNTAQREWRDLYHWLLTLNWPQFSVFILGVYLFINLAFALLYFLNPGCVVNMRHHSVLDAYFFSVETLATVGYGHMYPATLYGHLVAMTEIVIGMAGLAVITGLIFIRFSRPLARLVFSHSLVLGTFDGQPALMLRVANARHEAMAEAEFRVTMLREEKIREGDFVRFYPLKLQFDRLIAFPAAVTIRHLIDRDSPLHQITPEDLQRGKVRFYASVVCIDTVIPASIQSQKHYTWRDIRFGHRFVEIYSDGDDDELTVDYGRLHDTEKMPDDSRA
jgi:inward rectifier potassium channel